MEEVFEFGRKLQADGRFEEAEKCYRRYLEDHADSFKALNNLGVVLECQKKLDEAINYFERAVKLVPDSAIPRYNLGHALYQQDRLDAAANEFSTLLETHHDHGPARLNLGVIHWRLENLPDAEAELRKACDADDVAARAHSKLGDFLFEGGQYVDARNAYKNAAKIEEAPTHHFHAAVCDNLLRNTEAAIEGFARALDMDPAARLVHEHHVRAVLKTQDDDRIQDAFSMWQGAVPDDPICDHMHSAYSQDNTKLRCSKDYVRDTFSAFAGDFDQTLSKLEYSAPGLVANALTTLLKPKTTFGRVLDAGCGTGLCGPLVRPAVNTLIGVDLAAPMLVQAEKTNSYDELVEADLIDYLDENTTDYDAIFAADTFNYFGRLEELLNASRHQLRSGGHLIFTLEQSDTSDSPYKLMPHGRFEHSLEYVQQSITDCGLTLQKFDTFVLRKENGNNVNGWLVHAQKG